MIRVVLVNDVFICIIDGAKPVIIPVPRAIPERKHNTEFSKAMKIQCPTCRAAVPADQVNMGTDLAFCPQCNDAFKISDSIDLDKVNIDIVMSPPSGTWYREDFDKTIVGATTRSALAFFLVPFMCVWSGGSLGGIYGTQIAEGKFNLLFSLFGIPFIIGSVIFWTIALMAICGKVELTIDGYTGLVFVGIGSIGWKRQFDWSLVKSIYEEKGAANNNQACIVIDGEGLLRFGTGLSDERRRFVLNTLKYLLSKKRR